MQPQLNFSLRRSSVSASIRIGTAVLVIALCQFSGVFQTLHAADPVFASRMGMPGDNDGDGIPDADDLDDDNDTISDDNEMAGDSDNDGIPDYFDSDSDNDGITDLYEALTDLNILLELDQLNELDDTHEPGVIGFDGLLDSTVAVGSNGLADLTETFPDSGLGTTGYFDTDYDGVLDQLDLDSDNDGIPDIEESLIPDLVRDGRIDQFTDLDGDGYHENILLSPLFGVNDFDLDGVANFRDTDSDNDGRSDASEGLNQDENNIGRIDGFLDLNGDGLHDRYPEGPAGFIDTDCDGFPDMYDLDSNADGISDMQAGPATADSINPDVMPCIVTISNLEDEFVFEEPDHDDPIDDTPMVDAPVNGSGDEQPGNDAAVSDNTLITGRSGNVFGGCSFVAGGQSDRGAGLLLLLVLAVVGLLFKHRCKLH